jgi:hypothetical protein
MSSATFCSCSALSPLAMVVAQDRLLHAPECGAHGCDLRDDIDAVAVLLDHASEAAHLTLNAVEAFEARRFGVVGHALTDTLWGYICQSIPL